MLLTLSASKVSAKDPLQVYVLTTCGETVMTYLTGDFDEDIAYLREQNFIHCGCYDLPIYF